MYGFVKNKFPMKIFKGVIVAFLVLMISGFISWSIQEAYYLKAEYEVLELDRYALEKDQELQGLENELDSIQQELETEWAGWEDDYKTRVEEYRLKEEEYEKRAESYNQMVQKITYLMNDLENREYFIPIPGMDLKIKNY